VSGFITNFDKEVLRFKWWSGIGEDEYEDSSRTSRNFYIRMEYPDIAGHVVEWCNNPIFRYFVFNYFMCVYFMLVCDYLFFVVCSWV